LQPLGRDEEAAMPRRSRVSTGQFVFHVLNRAIQGVTLFELPADYEAFVEILAEALRRFPIRLLAYCIMPNHWHLVLWPLDDDSLSLFMKWLTAAHARQWRDARGTRGRGAVYQGRFKAIAVQHDRHFLRLCRYVERNAARAKLVPRAEDWHWGSAAPTVSLAGRPVLAPWPVRKPEDWMDLLNLPEPTRSLHSIRDAIRAGRHYGSASWRLRTSEALRWRSGLRQPGKPVAVDPSWVR
jgi:putative transposase